MGQAKVSEDTRNFLHGVAWALSVLTKGFGEPNQAAMVANEGNYTPEDFRAAGCEACDLEKWIEELEQMQERRSKRATQRRRKAAM